MVQWLNHFCCNKSTETKTGLKCHSCRNLNELFQMKKQTFLFSLVLVLVLLTNQLSEKQLLDSWTSLRHQSVERARLWSHFLMRVAKAARSVGVLLQTAWQRSEEWSLIIGVMWQNVSDVQRLHFWTVSVVVLLHACTNQPHRGERWTQLDVSRL